MDLNRKYINNKLFWRGHSCKILQAGDIFSARKVLEENEFNEAKFIYVHIGTNDIEKIESVEKVANGIISVGKLAKNLNPNANIIISEIPVRNDYLNKHRIEVNEFMEKCMPESIYFLNHRNVTRDMLSDKKHIKENCIHNMVRNMKNILRKILSNNQSNGYYYKSEKTHQVQGKQDLNFNVTDIKEKINSLVDYLTKF